MQPEGFISHLLANVGSPNFDASISTNNAFVHKLSVCIRLPRHWEAFQIFSTSSIAQAKTVHIPKAKFSLCRDPPLEGSLALNRDSWLTKE